MEFLYPHVNPSHFCSNCLIQLMLYSVFLCVNLVWYMDTTMDVYSWKTLNVTILPFNQFNAFGVGTVYKFIFVWS